MLVFLSLFGLTFLGCYEEEPPAGYSGVYRTGNGLDSKDHDGDGFSEADGDCDDTRADVYPGAYEICWDDDPTLPPGKLLPIDKNCDGDDFADAVDSFLAYPDNDGDGYGLAEGEQSVCFLATGYVENGDDCDDTVAAIQPLAKELCDGVDNDCNGLIDDDPDIGGSLYFEDDDGDGYGNLNVFAVACPDFHPTDYVTNSADCNDADAAIHPAATEVCDGGIDNDCTGLADEEEMPITSLPQWFSDEDGDSWGGVWSAAACTAPGEAYTNTPGDCNDADGSIYPTAVEVCDGINNDCDLAIDEDVTYTFYADSDTDGFGDPSKAIEACEEPEGYTTDNDDCNDTDASINPDASEVVGDEVDSDCDTTELCYLDADDDGLTDGAGDTMVSTDSDCQDATESTTMEGDDCDDGDALLGSLSTDADCDGVLSGDDCNDDNAESTTLATDADCDGTITAEDCDDGDDTSTILATDADCDGTLAAADCDDEDDTSTIIATDADCDGVLSGDDCNDDNAESTTLATDADCDGVITEEDCDDDNVDLPATDGDCDGSITEEDCDDEDPFAYPGAAYLEETPSACMRDVDGDGWAEATPLSETVDAGTDCDDENADRGSVLEDGDCDGTPTAEDCDDEDASLSEEDEDEDGISSCLGDCDDSDEYTYPGAAYLDFSGCMRDFDGDGFGEMEPPEGVDEGSDCDDEDPETGNIDFDADCDGVDIAVDCDDEDPSITDECPEVEDEDEGEDGETEADPAEGDDSAEE